MKRVVCILSLVALLFVGSVAVFADPHPVGGTTNISIPYPPIVTTEKPVPDSDS
ncbi:MAG: hypothetical protein KAX49_09705 [Halanaerobiales bacterium]|nr:hypothetical protein [Halanaerobiales bacterium]